MAKKAFRQESAEVLAEEQVIYKKKYIAYMEAIVDFATTDSSEKEKITFSDIHWQAKPSYCDMSDHDFATAIGDVGCVLEGASDIVTSRKVAFDANFIDLASLINLGRGQKILSSESSPEEIQREAISFLKDFYERYKGLFSTEPIVE